MTYTLNGYLEKNKEDDKLSNYAYKNVRIIILHLEKR
jgi:hypothetical protein